MIPDNGVAFIGTYSSVVLAALLVAGMVVVAKVALTAMRLLPKRKSFDVGGPFDQIL